jgi:hypothetical protein
MNNNICHVLQASFTPMEGSIRDGYSDLICDSYGTENLDGISGMCKANEKMQKINLKIKIDNSKFK